MFVVMGVTIFTSRIILQSLGITDYGVYSVVGGIAFSFGFFSSSMTNATQRYLSFGHGEGDIEKVKEYFNLITLLFIIGAAGIIIIGGGLGFWFVSLLNIPDDLYWPGVTVYYATLLSLIITLLVSVFDSVLIARESMTVYAYLSILEASLKLGLAYLIFIIPSYKLEFYAILSLLVTVITKGYIFLYCKLKFPECSFNLSWQPQKLKGIVSFMGWNGLGTIAWTLNEQGVNILINIFFGATINAARSIAAQVNAAINNFTSNFFLALNPQIIKRYASGDYSGTLNMMSKSSVFSYYLLWTICLPVILRRDYILGLWLKEVPDFTSQFLLWTLIYSLVNILTKPQWTVIQAIGNLKQYILNGCLTMLGVLPMSYLLYKFESIPQTALAIMALFRFIYVIISIITIRNHIQFSIINYIKEVFLPITIVSSFSYLILAIIDQQIDKSFIGLILITSISIVVSVTLAFAMMNKSDKATLISFLKKQRS